LTQLCGKHKFTIKTCEMALAAARIKPLPLIFFAFYRVWSRLLCFHLHIINTDIRTLPLVQCLLKCVKVGAQIISASLMSFEAVCCFFIMRQQCYQPTNSVYGQFYAKNAKNASYPQIKSGKVAFQQIFKIICETRLNNALT
jgi:hypothetical protein